jgi:Mn-dependent DtxR family transcriptional regulator
MNTNDQQLILRAIYDRSHAQRQNNASLDEVAADLGLPKGSVMYSTCVPLQNEGYIRLFGQFVQLTPEGRAIVENAC